MALNFDQMSNDELRQQMDIHGLPKVPITASTRNILIKRLQNHVNSSSPAKSANKSRRETVHVVKYSSDDDSDRDAAKEKLKKKLDNHKNARRQTIGAATSPIIPPPQPEPVEKASRKSMRATPTKTTRVPDVEPPQRIHKTVPVVIEDSDEDEPLVVRPAPISRRSKSNTPTLAKSDLVTTSYKQIVDTVHEDRETPEDDDEEPSDPEEEEPLATRYGTSRRTYDEPPANKSPVKPMSIRISPLRRTTLAGGSFRYEASPASKIDSYSRPSVTTSSYTSPLSNRYSSAATAKKRDDEPEVEDEFPYLREFSKRLSTLKAEAPLYKRTSAPVMTSSRTSTSSYTSSRTSNYRPLATRERESHFWDPVARFFAQMEQKYALKQKVLILLVILIVIFFLVMFWN